MTQRPSFYAFSGGLDQVTQAIAVPRGRVIACNNHEAVDRGYGRVAGYERYDGRTAPSAIYAQYEGDPGAEELRENARAAIGPVPGLGPVRGVACFNGQHYAWRDSVTGGRCIMYRATPNGWSVVFPDFPPGGRYLTINHNFYGATGRKAMFGVNGVGKGFMFDGTKVTFITTGMPADKPNRVIEFKQHLFFAFPGGSVQHSEPGEPTQWSATLGAGEIAVGSEITDFVSSVNALHICTVDSINTLIGSDAQDWQMQPLTEDEGTGAIPFTAQVMREPIYLDSGGLRGISATQQFGNFRAGTITPQIVRYLEARRKSKIPPVASVRVKNKDQYRLYYADGTGLSIYFGRKYPEPMLFDLGGTILTCIATEISVEGGERVFFGAEDGFVYEAESGTSYDGREITAFLQLPYDHEGSPWTIKRLHKAIFEVEAKPGSMIGVGVEFDYSDGEQRSHPLQYFNAVGGGGLWDIETWNDFYWSMPAEGKVEAYLDGQGSNASLLVVSNSAEMDSYILQGVTKMISVRGQKR